MHPRTCLPLLTVALTCLATASFGQVAAPASDELGMAQELGPATWTRCAAHLVHPRAKSYELSYVRSNTMPLSPFVGPFELTYRPTSAHPGTMQAYNVETLNENAIPNHQGTQIDAFGHFGYLDKVWDGTSPLSMDAVRYYGGLTQHDVKPTPDSPLLKLGMDKVPPIVTTAILLDAKAHVGKGTRMNAGEVVTSQHIEAMLKTQGLEERGIHPGDVVYIYTGWSKHYQDPDIDKVYYSMAPGLSFDAAHYLGDKRIVAVGLDTPFVDAVAAGQLAGKAGPPAGTPPGIAFPSHHYLLTQAGVYLLENLKLDELARERVATSCTIVLPLREQGASGSPIRPIAIGAPRE